MRLATSHPYAQLLRCMHKGSPLHIVPGHSPTILLTGKSWRMQVLPSIGLCAPIVPSLCYPIVLDLSWVPGDEEGGFYAGSQALAMAY